MELIGEICIWSVWIRVFVGSNQKQRILDTISQELNSKCFKIDYSVNWGY